MEINLTKSRSQTKKLGESLAKKILKTKPSKKAIVLGLVGDLGGGKTSFLQGFARGLGIKEKILSPTFVLMKRFSIKRKTFIHIDCYRFKGCKDLLELGFKNFISGSDNIIAVEWADKVKGIMPKNSIWMKFEFINNTTRKIEIKLKNGKQ